MLTRAARFPPPKIQTHSNRAATIRERINRNVGDWNVGDWNVGDWNVGDWNVGDWNVGDGPHWGPSPFACPFARPFARHSQFHVVDTNYTTWPAAQPEDQAH
ncbi:pentapeptide repeat-containing protein [Legionella waltersii]|uniref:pentapeptide repeat-containing protein n=1 Tax=Legionella waltersii TaxID=66969 RepID=UPI001930F942